ncbi:MAG: hypothetical protein GX594_17425 [Pirellulaceae bacterium]|nr:hypothetical protein [Pirellulaceae bacterium]
MVIDDGLYTHRWVAPLINRHEYETVCVACLSPYWAVDFNLRGARGLWPVVRSRLAYYGPAATVRFACNAAGTVLGGLRFRMGLGGAPGSAAAAAHAEGIRVLRPRGSDLNDVGFRASLEVLRPDLLVCAFSQKADKAFLVLPRLGCLNVHFSMLPQHRGREPLFHAMLAGRGAGVSVHWMTPELDAGLVLFQDPLETAGCRSLHRLILAACNLAKRVVPAAVEKACASKAAEVNTCPATSLVGWPSSEDVYRFKARGLRFI